VLTVPRAPLAFHVMAKPTGAVCNLDCEYCFFLSKEMLYPGSRVRMAADLIGDGHLAAGESLAERSQQGAELPGLDCQRIRIRRGCAASFARVEMHQLPHIDAAFLQKVAELKESHPVQGQPGHHGADLDGGRRPCGRPLGHR
jgi:hypothetical protein